MKTQLLLVPISLLILLFCTKALSQTISSLAPSSGIPGQVIDVIVRGASTNFKNGISYADFGAEITVEKFSVLDPATDIATIEINPLAPVGFRRVSITTNNETALSDNAFEIFSAGSTIKANIQVLPIETISLNDFDPFHPQNSPVLFFTNIYNDNTDRKVRVEMYLSSEDKGDLLKLYLLNKTLSPDSYTRLTSKDFDQLSTLGSEGNSFLNDIKTSGTFPPGVYTYKLLVKDARGNVLAEDKTTSNVTNPNANPELISPGTPITITNETDKVFIPQPLFQWFGQNNVYDFALYKLSNNQTPEEVVRTLPVFQQDDIKGNNFLYPLYAERLVEGQKYAWQIRAKVTGSAGIQYLPSPVFQFVYETPSASDSAVAAINIAPADIELSPGQQYQFNVTLMDRDNKPVTGIKPVWQLTPNKGFITQSGLFTAGNDNATLAVLVKAGVAAAFAIVTVKVPEKPMSEKLIMEELMRRMFGLPQKN